MGRRIVCAVDDSPHSQAIGTWAAVNLAKQGDTLHFISVAPPPSYAMTPAAPIASAGAYIQVAALSVNWEQQRKVDEDRCRHQLQQLVQELPEGAREGLDIHRHVLPAAGGASGVAESVVAFAKEKEADLVVVGSRGMGAVKSTFMSLVGLGSVSSYLVHNMRCPVAVCRGRPEDVEVKVQHRVMVSLDDSDTSRKALEWTVHNVLGPEDELHLVCVALPIPYPVSAFVDNHLPQPDVRGWRQRQQVALGEAEAVTRRWLQHALAQAPEQVSPAEDFTSPPLPADEWEATYRGSMQHTEATIVAEDAVASEVLEADEYDAASQDSIHYAREIVTRAVDTAAVKVDKSRIFFKALPPEGGASDVGESVVHYAKENKVDLVVMGARGMGSFKRAMMSFVGLGSVSDYVVSHVETPAIIVKQ